MQEGGKVLPSSRTDLVDLFTLIVKKPPQPRIHPKADTSATRALLGSGDYGALRPLKDLPTGDTTPPMNVLFSFLSARCLLAKAYSRLLKATIDVRLFNRYGFMSAHA